MSQPSIPPRPANMSQTRNVAWETAQVLRLLKWGASREWIAYNLGISSKTLERRLRGGGGLVQKEKKRKGHGFDDHKMGAWKKAHPQSRVRAASSYTRNAELLHKRRAENKRKAILEREDGDE